MRRGTDLAGLRHALRLPSPPPDVLVTQDARAHVLGHGLARRAGAFHVVVDHRAPELPLKPHWRALMRAIGRRVDRVITPTVRKLPQLERRGIPSSRVTVIPNGVPEQPPRPDEERAELRARLGLRDGEFAALLLSVLRPEKRPHAFVSAIARAHERNGRIRGLVVGDGPERGCVEGAARAAHGSVRVLGPRMDVADLVCAADVVCLSSAAEASPVALLEGMAGERPVVSPDLGGVGEIVCPGETGILTRPGDDKALTEAVLALAGDPRLASSMGRAGRIRQRAEFGAELMNDRYADALREVAP
jgi:glycosyltransferase involved in cell wall biosynthesis